MQADFRDRWMGFERRLPRAIRAGFDRPGRHVVDFHVPGFEPGDHDRVRVALVAGVVGRSAWGYLKKPEVEAQSFTGQRLIRKAPDYSGALKMG